MTEFSKLSTSKKCSFLASGSFHVRFLLSSATRKISSMFDIEDCRKRQKSSSLATEPVLCALGLTVLIWPSVWQWAFRYSSGDKTDRANREWWIDINYRVSCDVNVCFIRNMSISNLRLKFGRNYETFKKPRQAEFQILTCKQLFSQIDFWSNQQENRMNIHSMPHKTWACFFLHHNCLIWVVIVIGNLWM